MPKKTPSKAKNELTEAVGKLKIALSAHGGDIELVSFARGTVKVRLSGACHGCPMAAATLRDTVERYLVSKVPGVKRVVSAD